MPDVFAINPFIDDKVNEPRQIEPAIPGLNDIPLEALLWDFKSLEEGGVPRKKRSLPNARLVTSPDPGYGKSHLLGRLFEALGKRATLVNVRPFLVPESAWKSLLQHTVQELQCPDRFATEKGQDQPPQLVVFAHGVLSNLIVELFLLYRPLVKNNAVIQAIKNDPLAAYALSKRYPSWPKKIEPIIKEKEHFAKLLDLFSRHCTLHANASSWLNILFAMAFRRQESELQEACLGWLKGEAIEPEEAKEIGIKKSDEVPWDLSSNERNELAKKRVRDLCGLAVFFRPFLFCFDQTETYGDTEILARSLGQLVQEMWQELPNQMTVMTTNSDPWQKRIFPHWENAAKDRLDAKLQLEGLDKEQGRIFAENRMTRCNVEAKKVSLFLNDTWLSSLFQERKQLGIRSFLKSCQKRWEENPGETLPNLFAAKVHEAERSRIAYDENILLFSVATALRNAGGVVDQKKGEYAATWRGKQQVIRVVMDQNSHWRHWKKLAEDASKQKEGCFVFLRTLDLPPIPGPTWKVKPDIDQVMQGGKMRIEVLGQDEHVRLHAAWNLYAEAVAGDIPFTTEQVLVFLGDALKSFRDRILGVSGGTPLPPVEVPPIPPSPAPPPDLVRHLRAIMSKAKLLKEEDVLKRLGAAVTQEQLYSARERIPEIHLHCGPAMTVWQWVPKS